MSNCLRIELKKNMENSYFCGSLATALIFVAISTVYTWRLYYSDMGVGGIIVFLEKNSYSSKDNIYAAQNLYNSWIGADSQSVGASLFYIMAPLLAALACGVSFTEEVRSGYLHIIIPIKGRRPYFVSKLVAAFITGGIVLVVPQLVSLVITATYIPAVKSSILYNMYTPIVHGDMFAELFYSYPFIYILVVLAIDFVFGGLFAWLSMLVAFISKKAVASVIVPWLGILLADSGKTILYYISYIEISPLNILHPMSAPNYVKGWVVLIWLLIFFFISAPFLLIRGCKSEII